MNKRVLVGAMLAAAAGTAVNAAPSTRTYKLAVAEAAFGSVASFGTVKVSESANGGLDVLVSLAEGFRFNGSNKNHHALTFNLLGNPSLSFSGLSAGFATLGTTAASISQSPFGKGWEYGIDCIDLKSSAAGSGCKPGFNATNPTSLSFSVGSSQGALTVASLEAFSHQGQSIYFATDVVNARGVTGNVGAIATPVPEPSEWGMLVAGIGLAGWMARKRRLAFTGQ